MQATKDKTNGVATKKTLQTLEEKKAEIELQLAEEEKKKIEVTREKIAAIVKESGIPIGRLITLKDITKYQQPAEQIAQYLAGLQKDISIEI